MKKILAAVAALTALVFWACHLSPTDGGTSINVEGDSSWVDYDSLKIFLLDTNGTVLDTLFRGKLNALSQLNGLSAEKYAGGEAVFHIEGYRGDTLVFEQDRKFSERTGLAVVETTLVIGMPLKTLALAPESLSLYLGGGEGLIKVSGTPVFAKPELEWTATGDALDMVVKPGAWEARLLPKKEGDVTVTVHPKSDKVLQKSLVVHVLKDAPVLEISPAKAYIATGTKIEFSVKSRQAYGSVVEYAWDLDGDGAWDDSLAGTWKDKAADLPKQSHTYDQAGSFKPRFRAKDSEGNYGYGEAQVEVGERKPSVQLGPRNDTISIKDTVLFQGDISESGGKLSSYIWDFNGDGKPEDSASLTDSSTSLKVSRSFPDSGVYTVRLRAHDASGKVGEDSVIVTVLRDAPVLSPGQDTTAKSRVPIEFHGLATQKFGTVVMYKWDYDGNGVFDDSSAAPLMKTFTYPVEGVYKARFYARDDDDNITIRIRTITINDAPFLILSKHADTVISIRDSIVLTASIRNDDGKALQYGWDYDGDGKLDDSANSSLTTIPVSNGHRYLTAGSFKTVLQVKDITGKALTDTVAVQVDLDPPKADLGKDTTVLVGTLLKVRLLGADRFGSIVKRELDIGGTGTFVPLSQQETTLTMPATKTKLRLIGKVTDDDGQIGKDTMDVNVIYASENKLASLFISPPGIAIKPDFSPDSMAYAVTVANSLTSVVIGGAANDKNATVTVNGSPLSPSVTSVSVNLIVGVNAIPIVVTAQDSTTRTYTLNFKRLPSGNNNLSGISSSPALSLTPAFGPDVQAYTASVAYTVTSVSFGATTADKTAGVTVNGTPLSASVPAVPVALAVGSNALPIVVTAEDSTTKTYTVNITRLPSTNAALSALTTPSVPGLSPAFAPAGISYTLSIADIVDSVQVTPTAAETLAKITVNGVAVASGALSQKIAATVGTSAVTVVVTAPDNTTKKTYTITVKRPSWQPVGAAPFSPAHSGFQCMIQDKGVVYAGYIDSAASNKPVVMRKDSTGWVSLAPASIVDISASNMKLVMHKDVLYLGYNAPGSGYSAVYVRKFVGGTWQAVGAGHVIGPVGSDIFDLDFDLKDSVYMSQPIYYSTKNTSLWKFDGTNWRFFAQTVSGDSATYTMMAADPVSGTAGLAWMKVPYSAVTGTVMIDTLSIHKPTGIGSDTTVTTSFLPWGVSGWTAALVPIAFELDPSGIPYYVYAEPVNKKIAIKRLSGTSWIDVGPVGFSDGAATNFRLAFQGSTPIVAYRDATLKTVVVKQWTGSAWIPLGNPDILKGDVTGIDLSAGGTSAWLGFGDAANTNRATVEARILP